MYSLTSITWCCHMQCHSVCLWPSLWKKTEVLQHWRKWGRDPHSQRWWIGSLQLESQVVDKPIECYHENFLICSNCTLCTYQINSIGNRYAPRNYIRSNCKLLQKANENYYYYECNFHTWALSLTITHSTILMPACRFIRPWSSCMSCTQSLYYNNSYRL